MKRVLILGFLIVSLVIARTASYTPRSRIFDMKESDINAWNLKVLNDGRFGHNAQTGDPGGYWPQPLHNYYLFGAGIWIGAYDKDSSQALVSYGYNPNSGASEMVPAIHDYWEQGYGNPQDRIYKSTEDDWSAVPWERFHITWGPEGPQVFSLQDMFCAFSDFDPATHDPGDTRPIGVDIYLWVYAWNYTSNRDIVFLKYVIKNVTDHPIDSMYVAAVVDPDIGDYRDDMIGLILKKTFYDPETGDSLYVDNVGFCWDYDGKETPRPQWESGIPGVMAYDYLQSPYALNDGIDNDGDGLTDEQELDSTLLIAKYPPYGDRDGDGVPDWEDPSEIEQLGLTAFKRFTIDIDPPTDKDRYMMMAGYDYRSGIYMPYDSIDPGPADKRFLQSTGPFSLAPGDSTVLVVAVIAAEYWINGEQDTLPLAKVSSTAQFIYDMNWLLPAPPPSPNVRLIPRDKEIIITWDNYSETQPDPYYKIASLPGSAGYDPNYKEYDFEGYKLYKSEDGKEWELLATFDKKDGIVFSDTTSADSNRWIIADDKGLKYYYVDDDVVNGFPYYYAVSAFDYNYYTTFRWVYTDSIAVDTFVNNKGDTIFIWEYSDSTLDSIPVAFWLEGGKKPVSAIPRTQPCEYVESKVYVNVVSGDTMSPGVSIEVTPIYPPLGEVITFDMEFKGPVYTGSSDEVIYPYQISWKDSVYNDSVKIVFGEPDSVELFPFLSGSAFKLTWDVDKISQAFENIILEKGSYPLDIIKFPKATKAVWAYRGSDFKITWHKNGNILSIDVLDMDHNIEVPFVEFSSEHPENADGWAFQFAKEGPKNILDPYNDNISAIYLCGGYIQLKDKGNEPLGDLASYINDGDVWIVKGAKVQKTTPGYNKYQITLESEKLLEDTTLTLNVKVVPNPYIMYNRWEIRREARKIAFINLPSECTIRIYTLAGDLVKVIEHKAVSEDEDKGGMEFWNLLNMHDQIVASGVYIFHVESKVGSQVGKFAILH